MNQKFIVVENEVKYHHKNAVYKGVDRHPWIDIENEIYNSGHTNSSQSNYFDKVAPYDQYLGLHCCNSLSSCLELYRIFGIDMKGKAIISIENIGSLSQSEFYFLGFDVWSCGEWSLLKEGLINCEDEFFSEVAKINKNGLLEDMESCEVFAKLYLEAVTRGLVEESSGESSIRFIKVFSVED